MRTIESLLFQHSEVLSYDEEIVERDSINNMHLAALFEEESICNNQSLRGLTGLRNLGNTCYMNSALQTLSNCPPLREYFRSFLPNKYELAVGSLPMSDDFSRELRAPSTQTLSNAFKNLMTTIWSDAQHSCISPALFLLKVREKCPQFRGFNQQDSQEFVRCFLDCLHQELRRPVRKWEMDLLNENIALNIPSLSDNEDKSSDGSSNNSVSSQQNIDDVNDEHFETADSGLSSDTEDAPRGNNKNKQDSNFRTEQNAADKIVGYKSIVTDVFDGELLSSVKCQTCQRISYTRENFQDISLSIPTVEQLEYIRDVSSSADSLLQSSNAGRANLSKSKVVSTESYIPWIFTIVSRWLFQPWFQWMTYFYRYMFTGSISLENCLRAFFSTDFLHGEDMYSCEKCEKLRNGVKQCELIRLPEILCIHLKRFRHDSIYNTKVSTKVTFPLCDLDLRPFVRPSVLEKNERMVTEYDLVAIISHHGGSVDFGHYVAYCRNEFDKNWYEYDDSLVTRVSALEVMNKEVYVMFYQKKNSDEMDDIRAQCQDLLRYSMRPSRRGVEIDRYYISKEWLHKFLTFSEPGPVNNCDFLCKHGNVAPMHHGNGDYDGQLFLISTCVYVHEEVWSFLQMNMGGGPPCRQLTECAQCRRLCKIAVSCAEN